MMSGCQTVTRSERHAPHNILVTRASQKNHLIHRGQVRNTFMCLCVLVPPRAGSATRRAGLGHRRLTFLLLCQGSRHRYRSQFARNTACRSSCACQLRAAAPWFVSRAETDRCPPAAVCASGSRRCDVPSAGICDAFLVEDIPQCCVKLGRLLSASILRAALPFEAPKHDGADYRRCSHAADSPSWGSDRGLARPGSGSSDTPGLNAPCCPAARTPASLGITLQSCTVLLQAQRSAQLALH